MPRIRANSISEHIAEQEAAVFAAAIRLFGERGYDNVSLAEIAAEVGLARNSLYRYFPDKAHILVRWFEQELPRQVTRSAELLEGPEPARERIERWALATLDYAETLEHRLAAELESLVPELDPETRQELAESHIRLHAPLEQVLSEAGVDDRGERTLLADLMTRFVVAAAQTKAHAADGEAVKRRLLQALDSLLP